MNTGFCTMVFYTILQEESNHAHQHRRKALPGCSLPGRRIRLRYLRRLRRAQEYVLHMDQAVHCDHDRLRSCCQPAGVYQNETETSKVGEEDRDFTKGQLHGFSVASRKAARACQIGQYSVHALCEALCVSRGTFYNHIFRRKEVTAYDKRRAEMKEHIQAAFDESQQRFGANKIAAVLADRGVRTSPKYVAELMREMGLQSVSIYSKRDYQKSERLAKKQNMLQQQFKVDEPNRVWVSDITCFKVNGKYLYICVILDLFSRKVVAHRVSPKNSTYLVTSTFRQVYRNRNEPQQLMFHSDQGPQYTSNTFRKLLRINKVVQSFSKSSRPHDNAVAESFFASMKREEIYRTQYCSERQFMQSVDTYIEFYNTKRPHSTLNYRTPDRFELLHAQRKERTG